MEPHSDMEIAHHMLLFGCSGEPNILGRNNVWECQSHGACKREQETVLYGWGRNAPKLVLPEGVGFSLGGDVGLKNLVLQVHYLSVRPPEDHSGVTLTLKTEPSKYSTGMITYARMFQIPPHEDSYLINNTCCYSGFESITTMAFRVHTHTLGRSVYMTRMSGKFPGNGVRIAERSPQLPQGFVPVEEEKIIRPGENLRVTCDFNSTSVNHTVTAGPTHNHEMCNMYMMTYSEVPHFLYCAGDFGVVELDGTGGMPSTSTFIQESEVLGAWQPPKLGEQVAGVSRGPDGSIWALHRGPRVWGVKTFGRDFQMVDKTPIEVDVVIQLEPDTGKMLRTWGRDLFYMPHMITADYEGNVWVADAGMHQVLKFTSDGDWLMSVGTALEPGSDDLHLCQPTQVVPLNDGGFLVSDGYCNQRVLKYSKEGKVIGIAQDPTFMVVHSLLVDECHDYIYAANREAGKILVFGLSDMLKKGTVDLSRDGKVFSLTLGPYGTILVMVGLWEEGSKLWVYQIGWDEIFRKERWEVAGVQNPHDFVMAAAPMEVTGAGARLLSIYVAETRPSLSELKKFILVPEGLTPEKKALTNTTAVPSSTEGTDAPLEEQVPQQPAAEPEHFSDFSDPFLDGLITGDEKADDSPRDEVYDAPPVQESEELSENRAPEEDVENVGEDTDGEGEDTINSVDGDAIMDGHLAIEANVRAHNPAMDDNILGHQVPTWVPPDVEDNRPSWAFGALLRLVYVAGPVAALALLAGFMWRRNGRNLRYHRVPA